MATVDWSKVKQGITATCQYLHDVTYKYNTGERITFHPGQHFTSTYQGYQIGEEGYYTLLFTWPKHKYDFPVPLEAVAASLEAKQCLKCQWYLPLKRFGYNLYTVDRSPLLDEVCSDCYKSLRNKINAYSNEARRQGAIGELQVSEWLELLKASQGYCHYCRIFVGFDGLVIEHCKPLALRGDNTRENVVPACDSCNCSKSRRDVHAWKQNLEARRLTVQLQERLELSKLEVANMAIKTLAHEIGIIEEGAGHE